jgi:hypothetical protein
MTRLIGAIAVLIAGTTASRADEPTGFAGEWKTTAGPVILEQQKGDEVTGKIVAWNLRLKGRLQEQGKTLALTYVENGVTIDATLRLDTKGHAFTGVSKASNGNQWAWNGWRPDPTAASGKPGHFSGLWLTDLGLMELAGEESMVKGRYALRGTSSLEGDVKGRHLDFTLKTFRFTGPGFFDLDENGTRLAGAAGTDGDPRWYGWNGRKADE